MTRQAGPQVFQIVSKYLVSPTGSEGSFTTISGAITQAVADGAAAASPKVIVIKPGTYTENITLPDGIALVGLDQKLPVFRSEFDSFHSVIIDGTITFSSGEATINNLKIERTTEKCIIHEGGTLNLSNISYSVSGAGTIHSFEGTTTKSLTMDKCGTSSTSPQCFFSDGANATINIQLNYCSFSCSQSVFSGPDGTVNLRAFDCEFTHDFDVDCNLINWRLQGCRISSSETYALDIGENTSGILDGFNTNFNIAKPAIVRNNSVDFRLTKGVGGDFDINYSDDQRRQAIAYQTYRLPNVVLGNRTGTGTLSNPAGFAHRSNIRGYRKTELIQLTGGTRTTDATPWRFFEIELQSNQGITIFSTISAIRSDFSAYCGGNITGCARRAGAGAVLVGAPVKNVLEDSGGSPTFDIDVSGNLARIMITGIAAQTWNWTGHIQYQLIESQL